MLTPASQPSTWFLDWLYEDGHGYIEIVAGRTNPDDPKKISLVMRTRRWCYYDPERPDLRDQAVASIAQLANQYGNVYVGCRLYTREAKDRNERSEARTLPSKVIFIDDAPDEPYLRYSLSVRTSEGSLHAYYKCDRPTTKDDARRAAGYLDGDPSGVDLTQLVRVPGTFNTKHGQRFPVVIEDVGPTYQFADLRAKFPEVAPEQRKDSGATIEALNWPEVETHLANIKTLLTCARAQLIKPETQTGRILAGELLTIGDGSRSMNKYVAMYGLYLRGFADDEIAAVGIHLDRQWGVERDKGTAWCKLDTARILAKCHTKMPGVKQSPTRYRKDVQAQPIADVRPISRARADRPQHFTPAALFLEYQQHPEVCDLKRKARAATLGISTAALDRLEKELRTCEPPLIEVETDPQRQGSRVILVGVINIPSSEVLSAAPDTEPSELPSISAESGQTAIDAPQCIGGTRPPPDTPAGVSPQTTPVAPPTLHDAIVDYLDCYTEAPRKVPDRKTGEVRLVAYVRTVERFLVLLNAAMPGRWPEQQVRNAYRSVLRARRADYWRSERAKLHPDVLDTDGLYAAIRARQRGLARNIGRKLEGQWRKRLELADEERQRRKLPPEPVTPGKRKSGRADRGSVPVSGQAGLWGAL